MGSQVMGSNLSGRVLAGVLVLALVVAACGGGGEVDEVAERELEGSNGTATVARDLDPVTTVAATTTTTTEVVETTTTAATTSTTLAPTEEQQRVEIIAAVEEYREVWRECLRQLPDCDTSRFAETRAGNQLKVSTELAEEWNALGYRAENVESLETRVDVVRFFDDAQDVELEVCETDGVVIFDGDEVVNGDYVSARLYFLVLEADDAWKVFRVNQDEAAVGVENDLCV